MLLLFALIVGSSSVWAEDPKDTFNFSSAELTNNSISGTYCTLSVAQGDGSSAPQINSGKLRFYNSNTISFNAASNYAITNIVFTAQTSSSYGFYGNNDFDVSEGTFTATTNTDGNGATGTWSSTDGVASVTFTSKKSKQFRFSQIVVTLKLLSNDPSISANAVNIAYDATSGEFSYLISNPVNGATLEASSSDSWITNVAVNSTNNKVTFNTTANNETTPREGKITLSYKQSNQVLVSKDVTITQAKAVATITYNLATTIVPGRCYIITNGSNYAMGLDRGNNRGAVEITTSNGSTNISSEAGVYEFLIKVDETDDGPGFFTIYDTENKGYLCAASSSSNQLKYQSTLDNNGRWIITIDENGKAFVKAQGTYTRNLMRFNSGNNPPIFACYATGQDDIYLFEKVGDNRTQDFTVSINAACTDGTKYYGTFSAPFAFTVPAGVTVSEIGIDNVGKLAVEEYAENAVIPANTGVMISSMTSGNKTFTSAKGGTSVKGANNKLRPTYWGLTETEMGAADDDCLFYRLTMHNGTQIGFWWGAAEGAAFDIAANKAYLAVPEDTAAPEMGVWIDDETTGIVNVNRETITNNQYYTLDGRRVAEPTKGLYIINGKKVILK